MEWQDVFREIKNTHDFTELNEILNTLKNVEANDIAEKTEKILQTKVSFEMMND